MESEIKSLFNEENIGNECLSDLMNFGRFCFFLGPTFKGEFCFKVESGPYISFSFNINCCLFFSKGIQKLCILMTCS